VTDKVKLGISACLLGEKVRYDGGHQLDHFLTDTLGKFVEWVPVCPEVEYGLPVPREAMRLVGDPESPRLMTIRTGVDHTEGMVRWAQGRLRELEKEDLCGFIFKSRSPSSGMRGVKVYTPSGMPSTRGIGIFAGEFMKRLPLMPVEDDGRMHDPVLRENFIERIFVFQRWREFKGRGGALRDLISFHSDHKLLILSHSPKHYAALGRLVAEGKKFKPDTLHGEYLTTLMEGLKAIATTKKNTNVLTHIVGYFKQRLPQDERKELLDVIETYHMGLVPLIVPIVMLKHYVRKYNEPYLARQYYLTPHPAELMLRNHV
jgi:uncharacterized protein YbgA (DUF1722 family)/uncharacterized protein YbbK (DUF523 family)